MTTPSAAVSYTSDARNLRQSRTEDGLTRQFTWSNLGGIPLLLDDGQHSYVYGPSLTPLAQVDDVTSEIEYLHADLLGTPRLVTDDAGEAVGTSTFDAFGTLGAHSGVQSAFGFTGNLFDAVTGLLYLRARDYDAATGQFLTVDPLVDQTRQPYAYVGNNPIMLTDPSGLAAAEVGAFFLGALDGLTGGISSAILEEAVPGYDCFIKAHNTAFTAGSVIAQVAVAVVTIVGTAGAGALLIAAKYAVTAGVRAGIKAGAKWAINGARQLMAGAARTLRGGADNATGAAGRRTANQTSDALTCQVKNSFTAGTSVLMADRTQKPIEEVRVGDEVLATDPQTGESGARKVQELIRHGGDHTMVDVTLDDGTVIEATDEHPFWSANRGEFVFAIEIEVGDLVLGADGDLLTVTETVVYVEDLIAYNLAIEGIHTYYVGETPVLVHNTCPPSNLASDRRTTHILDSDVTGGGHLWPGKPNKTPFPSDWGRDKIMDAISDVVTSPSSVAGPIEGSRTAIYGVYDDVLIKVVTDWRDIITAHPVPWGR